MTALVQVWLDDPRVGSGRRLLVVAARGRLWATLLCPTTLNTVRVPVAALAAAHPLDDPAAARRTARRIRANARHRRELGLRCAPKAVVAAALEALR